MIAAARAVLDIAEEMVKDPAAHRRCRRDGRGGRRRRRPHRRPEPRAAADADAPTPEPRVQHIRVPSLAPLSRAFVRELAGGSRRPGPGRRRSTSTSTVAVTSDPPTTRPCSSAWPRSTAEHDAATCPSGSSSPVVGQGGFRPLARARRRRLLRRRRVGDHRAARAGAQPARRQRHAACRPARGRARQPRALRRAARRPAAGPDVRASSSASCSTAASCSTSCPRHEDDGGDCDRDQVHDHQAAAPSTT